MLNFAPWNELLNRYVDDEGRVDYRTWQARSRDTFYQLPVPVGAGLARIMICVNTLISKSALSPVTGYPISNRQSSILQLGRKDLETFVVSS
jgi:hypothetical protein